MSAGRVLEPMSTQAVTRIDVPKLEITETSKIQIPRVFSRLSLRVGPGDLSCEESLGVLMQEI
jgi:hypothetical protein